jgi:hypothetical protein
MHSRPRPFSLTVLLPSPDYQVYRAATRLLRRIMGAKAPDLEGLVRSKLENQDATGLVEDYLELRRWPANARPLLLPSKGGRRDRVEVWPRGPKARGGRSGLPADPSRN